MWLTPANTIISGIPPEGAKDTSFVVIASDGELNDTLKVSVKVIPVNDPPVIISLANITVTEDSLFQYITRATDPEGDKITYAFKNYPHWMIAADSTISGIPLEATKDTSFIVIASDGKLNDTLMVNVTIIPINDPPKLISAKIDTAYEDSIFEYLAKAIDPENDRINYIFKNYPTWLEPAGATISGIPLEGTKDSCFTVIASDGKLNDTLEVFVTVIPVNDPPIIISPSAVNAYEDSLFTYTAKATDPEHDEITYAFKNYPHWMAPADSVISGLVKKGTVDTSFTVIASDGNLIDTLVVNVKFIEKNDPPQIISQAFATAYEDSLFSYTAKAIDPENDKITFLFKSYPTWLTPKDSTISGTPTEGIGDTSFIIIASDGKLTDTLEIAITVIPINDPPQIIHLSDFVFENTGTYIIDLDTCVVDEDHKPESLTWRVIVADSNLKAILTDHIASFNAPDWTGTTEAKFIVTDPQGASDSAMIKITVELPSTVENNENTIPKDFFLSQNYPNPFNPRTTIHFGIPKSSEISIIIYNVKGELIESLFNGKKDAGNHFVIWDAKDNPSGIYLIRLETDSYIQVKKCLLMK
jgi:hypothetical protein